MPPMPLFLVVLGVSQETTSFCYYSPTERRTADSLPPSSALSFVVGAAFLPPSGLAVMLGPLRVAKHLGGIGRFALGAGGPLVRSGGVLMRPAPTLDALVMLVLVAGHRMSLPAGRPLTMSLRPHGTSG